MIVIVIVIAWHYIVLVILYPPYVCASLSWGSPARHPIRTKSDFTKRLHHLGGLLWSRHWDALQLRDCLHSFSQQLTHSASALKQISPCLMFEGAAGRDRSIVYRSTSCASSSYNRSFYNNSVWNKMGTLQQCERGIFALLYFKELYSFISLFSCLARNLYCHSLHFQSAVFSLSRQHFSAKYL